MRGHHERPLTHWAPKPSPPAVGLAWPACFVAVLRRCAASPSGLRLPFGPSEANETPRKPFGRTLSWIAEWTKLSKGLEQRVRGLDAFLGGIYHEQVILKAVKIPSAKVLDNALYRPEMQDIEVPVPAPLKPWTDASSITSISITSLPPPPAWARMAPGPWEE
ncbi:MAG: circularly permuted type 2 ATP-grasp protein [Rhodospirillales bacterium]|nr:circularly permuted type 2 ATP-grasp protein [Rhodospirillales bacterium]